MRFVGGMIVALTLVTCATAQQKSYPWVSTPAQLSLPPGALSEWFDAENAVLYQVHAADLIWQTMGGCFQPATKTQVAQVQPCPPGNKPPFAFPGPNDYVVIHVLRWKDLKP